MRNEQLIEDALQGKHSAFEQLYYAYVDRVHQQIYSMVRSNTDLEDLIQQTFVQVHKHLKNFRGDSAFSTWLQRIAINVALGHLRKQKRWTGLKESLNQDPTAADEVVRLSPLRAVEQEESRTLLKRVLEQLKPKKRLVFVLYEVEGHTLEEIAEIAETSINTVASRLRSARIEVRRSIELFRKAENRDSQRDMA